ncbi:hypothetical protein Arub01_40210 [Actinomadura rubrobrunea]|uniref:Uncharacterized protein n=1 Tax=Actinomadura rubrobrunea TaxID=115335 RepID=A0A9W6UY05_9ACTN|nr:hypothetical protein Arub01_40210 [Actinomadura rubrobrunea]
MLEALGKIEVLVEDRFLGNILQGVHERLSLAVFVSRFHDAQNRINTLPHTRAISQLPRIFHHA